MRLIACCLSQFDEGASSDAAAAAAAAEQVFSHRRSWDKNPRFGWALPIDRRNIGSQAGIAPRHISTAAQIHTHTVLGPEHEHEEQEALTHFHKGTDKKILCLDAQAKHHKP